MKRFLFACSLALGALVADNQQASAWNKFNFNIGMNISYEAAENNFLWGVFRSGPHPYAQAQQYGQQGQQGFGGYGDPGMQYYPGPQGALPAPAQSTPVQAAPSNMQTSPVSYNQIQQAGYVWPNYYYQAPSYWYGN